MEDEEDMEEEEDVEEDKEEIEDKGVGVQRKKKRRKVSYSYPKGSCCGSSNTKHF